MASDMADAAAEFIGSDLGSRVVFDHDEVRSAFHIADGDAAVRLHRVASQSHFVMVGRCGAADRKNLDLPKRHVFIAGSNQHMLLASAAKFHQRIELVRLFASLPGDIRLVAKRLGQKLFHIANLAQDREQSRLRLIRVVRPLCRITMNQPIE